MCPELSLIVPTSSALVRNGPFLSEMTTLNAICIHQPCQSQLLISTATPWRNWPLNHPPRRPPSSVLFCLKSKPRYARERRTNKSGNGSPKPGSISRAKRFAGSFAAHVKEIAYPRRGGKSVEAPKLHVTNCDQRGTRSGSQFPKSRSAQTGFSLSSYARRRCLGAWKKGIP